MTTPLLDVVGGYDAEQQAAFRDAIALSGISNESIKIGTLDAMYQDGNSLRMGTGTRSIYGSAIIVTRDYIAADNGHGFDENSTIAPTVNDRGYASFDARGQITASEDMNHYVGYQFDPEKSGSGDIGAIIGLSSILTVSDGTVEQFRHVSIGDALVSGTGEITTQYGVYISGLTSADKNWAIYSQAPTESYHAGNVGIGGPERSLASTLDVYGALKAGGDTIYQVVIGRTFSESEGGVYIQSAGTYGEMQALHEGVGYLPLVLQRRGGSTMIGTTTDNGLPFQVAGPMSLAPGASVVPPNIGDLVFEATSNTSVTVKLKGSDGIVRTVALTLA